MRKDIFFIEIFPHMPILVRITFPSQELFLKNSAASVDFRLSRYNIYYFNLP